MITRIKIDKMRLHAYHGVLPQERTVGNDFAVSVEMRINYDGSDLLNASVSYADVAATVRREMKVPSALIEHAAARIAKAIIREYTPVAWCRVTVAKLTPPMDAEVEQVSATVEL